MRRMCSRLPAPAGQQGFSLLGGLITLLVVIVLGRMVIVMFPAYYDNYVVTSTINNALDDAAASSGSIGDLRTSLRKRFDINDIHAVNVGDLDIQQADGGLRVGLDYTVKTPFFYNASLLMHFKHNFTQSVVAQ